MAGLIEQAIEGLSRLNAGVGVPKLQPLALGDVLVRLEADTECRPRPGA